MRSYDCSTCGVNFSHPDGAGRPPKHCPEHRKKSGGNRDDAGNRERFRARRHEQQAAKRSNASASDLLRSADLAAALSIFPNVEHAARFAGIEAVGGELLDLEALARGAHQGVIDGDPAELGRRLMATVHLMVTSAVRQRALIAPRDLPHVARALAQVHQIMVGEGKSRFAEVKLFLLGADGKPFDPNVELEQEPTTAVH